MRRIAMFAAAIAFAVPAIAAEAPVKKEINLNPAGTTILDCLNILAGLNDIDSKHDVIVNAGKPNEQVIQTGYVFGKGTLRLDIAKDISILSVVQKDQQAAQQKILAEVSKGKGSIDAPAADASKADKDEYQRQVADYSKQMTELGTHACPTDNLTRIKAADLKLDVNEIRAAALAAIDKILDK